MAIALDVPVPGDLSEVKAVEGAPSYSSRAADVGVYITASNVVAAAPPAEVEVDCVDTGGKAKDKGKEEHVSKGCGRLDDWMIG